MQVTPWGGAFEGIRGVEIMSGERHPNKHRVNMNVTGVYVLSMA